MSVLAHEKKVEIGGQTIVLRDLPWPMMKQFLEKLSGHIKPLMDESLGAARMGADAATVGAKLLDQLPALIKNATDLAEFLVSRTVHLEGGNGRLETADWLQERSSSEFLELLDGAMEVVFNEEFIRLGKSVAGRVSSAFSLAAATPAIPPSRRHVISSSGKDGPGPTSSDSPSPS